MEGKKVAIVTPEYYGLAMAGGLGMAVHGLAQALQKQGMDVSVIMPAYYGDKPFVNYMAKNLEGFNVDFSEVDGIKIRTVEGLKIGEPIASGPLAPYISDSVYRIESVRAFTAASVFGAAIPVVLQKIEAESNWVPDIIHLHEWQTAPAVFELRNNDKFKKTPVVMTIHNANYIGAVPSPKNLHDYFLKGLIEDSGISKAMTVVIQRDGDYFASLLEMGVHYSDTVTTVSQSYTKEILDGSAGIEKGLERRIKEKSSEGALVGILNGIDYELMNPKKDPHIIPFDPDDLESVAYGKGLNKLRLTQFLNNTKGGHLEPDSRTMHISMMSRLVKEKGIDMVLGALGMLEKVGGIQLLIVGEAYDNNMRREVDYLRKGNLIGCSHFVGPQVQHLILAGSDAMLVPSLSEPCGLVPMEGMRYGALPITTAVGGMRDTIIPFYEKEGYGFCIEERSAKGIVSAIIRAREVFNDKQQWRVAVKNALTRDFSWDHAVGNYIELYERLLQNSQPS